MSLKKMVIPKYKIIREINLNNLTILYISKKIIQMKSLKIIFLLLFTAFISCNDTSNSVSNLETIHANIKQQLAPDKRVELFDIKFEIKNNTLVLKGETTTKKAFNLLLDSLKMKNISFKNEVRILPDSAVGNRKYALGNNSVINIRTHPRHSSELGT